MRYDFHPEALLEFEQAAHYYAEQEPDLALRFVESVERSVRLILESPTRWRRIDDEVHRCLTSVFPFGILYAIEPNFVLIVAVMHCSREPGYWKHRIAS